MIAASEHSQQHEREHDDTTAPVHVGGRDPTGRSMTFAGYPRLLSEPRSRAEARADDHPSARSNPACEHRRVAADLISTLVGWYRAHARVLPWRGADVSAVGGPGQRDHAAADAGGPGRARLPGVARRAGPRPPIWPPSRRGGGADVGQAGLPAPGAAPARVRPASSPSGTAARCPPMSTSCCAAGRRRLHRPGGGGVRLRAAAAGRRHERAAGGGPRRARARATRGRRRPRATWPSSRRCCRPTPARRREFSIALMELGALVCTARAPALRRCARSGRSARGGRPALPPTRDRRSRPQRFAGTDRQVRGRLMDVLRAADGPVAGRAAGRRVARPGAAGARAGRPDRRRPGRPAARRPFRPAHLSELSRRKWRYARDRWRGGNSMLSGRAMRRPAPRVRGSGPVELVELVGRAQRLGRGVGDHDVGTGEGLASPRK